jgi:hypothetical protein
VPVDAFERFFREGGASHLQPGLDEIGGETPVLPPTADQPAPTVPLLRVRIPLP